MIIVCATTHVGRRTPFTQSVRLVQSSLVMVWAVGKVVDCENHRSEHEVVTKSGTSLAAPAVSLKFPE